MCPDKEILSAYLDGEVPSPWDKKISEHLEGCADCACRLGHLQSVSSLLKSVDLVSGTDIQAGKERIFESIMSSRRGAGGHERFWSRQVPVPAPLLAAAAVLVVMLGIGLFTGTPSSSQPVAETPSAASGTDIYTVKLSDGKMENLAEVLKNRDAQVQVFIDLPPSSYFDSGTEPQFIRAADYHR